MVSSSLRQFFVRTRAAEKKPNARNLKCSFNVLFCEKTLPALQPSLDFSITTDPAKIRKTRKDTRRAKSFWAILRHVIIMIMKVMIPPRYRGNTQITGRRKELVARLLVARSARRAFEVWLGMTSDAGEGLVRSNVPRNAELSKSIFVTGYVCYPTYCCQTCSVKQTGKGARFRARSESPRKSRRAGQTKTNYGKWGRQPPARRRIGKFFISQALAGELIKLCIRSSNLTRNKTGQ